MQNTRTSNRNSPVFEMFSQMVRDFSSTERKAILKFATGSNRIDNIEMRVRIYSKAESHPKEARFPIGHTCGSSMDVFECRSLDEMKEVFRIAINNCGEIDADGEYSEEYAPDHPEDGPEEYYELVEPNDRSREEVGNRFEWNQVYNIVNPNDNESQNSWDETYDWDNVMQPQYW